jgi:hypothetical protein
MVKRSAALGLTGAARSRLARVSTLALRIADRIVTAGRYHTADLAGREDDYQRFHRPPVRKARKKKAPTKTKTTTPTTTTTTT